MLLLVTQYNTRLGIFYLLVYFSTRRHNVNVSRNLLTYIQQNLDIRTGKLSVVAAF